VQFAKILISDRCDRDLTHTPSALQRPGPEAFVVKQLRPVQSFYNIRNQTAEYNGDLMLTGQTGDIIVLPMARLNLKYLAARQHPTTGRFYITQEALRYVQSSGATIRPGETIHTLKERVRQSHEEEKIEWEE
jgi:hypothetical protein